MTLPKRFLLGSLAAAALGSQARAAEPDLSALMARLAAVPERRATFRETRRFAALDQPLESTGRLLYRRPDYLEKLTDFPEREQLVMDGGRLVLTSAQDAPRVVDLQSQPELRTLADALRGPLSGDIAALQRAFTIRLEGTDAAWQLDLQPRDPRAARLLRRVTVGGAGAEIRTLLLVQANGDEQRMTITAAP